MINLLDKEKREAIKEPIEVVFAVLTIVSFIHSRVQKHKAAHGEEEQAEQSQTAAAL